MSETDVKKYDVKFWLTLIGQVILAFTIFIILSEWQASDMRDTGVKVSPLTSPTLNGNTITFPDKIFSNNALSSNASALNNHSSENTLVYFFAPWCTVCDLSMGNLNLLHEQFNADITILIVALDYQSISEVEEFIADKELNFPVILGDARWAREYQIQAFPSYYILDSNGAILSRSMGYSSTLGMLSRLTYVKQ